MNPEEVKGYALEGAIRQLLAKNHYFDITSYIVNGRSGVKHQIDAQGQWVFPIPFVYPLRILIEAKWHEKDNVGLSEVRNFLSVLKDIDECFYPIKNNMKPKPRYHYAAAIVSATDFSDDAEQFAWAHGIYLLPLKQTILYDELKNKLNLILSTINGKKSAISKGMEIINQNQPIFIYPALLEISRRKRDPETYLVMLQTQNEFDIKPDEPDEINTKKEAFHMNFASREDDHHLIFKFPLRRSIVEMPLPTFCQKILFRKNRNIFNLQIPIVIKKDTVMYRRIFKVHIKFNPEIEKERFRQYKENKFPFAITETTNGTSESIIPTKRSSYIELHQYENHKDFYTWQTIKP